MEKIEIKGSAGDEVALVYNGKMLAVKLTEERIVPDFVDAVIKAMNMDADGIIHSAMRIYHKYPNAEIIAREKLGAIRDALFASIVATPTENQEVEQETKAKRSTRKAKAEQQEQANE